MENISIPRVEAKDAEFLFRLMNDESVLNALNEVTTSFAAWEKGVAQMRDDPDEEDYEILDDSTPVGWLGVNGLASPKRQAWIKIIAILPDKQGLGIGPYAINQVIENLKLRGYESIALYTDRENVNAQKCYQKCGFMIIDTVVRKMANGKYVERYKMGRAKIAFAIHLRASISPSPRRRTGGDACATS